MSVYNSHCGKFELEITDPWPMWAHLQVDGEEVPRGLTYADLHDLRHLCDRAIAAAEAKVQEIEGRRGR